MNENLFLSMRKEVLEIRDRQPTVSLDNAFVAWFLRAFVVDDEDTAIQSLTGGSCDKGVDAIFVDHDSRSVFLVQGKYHQGNRVSAENRSDVIALADLGRSLLHDNNQAFKTIINNADESVKKGLENARSAIHRSGYRLNLQYVTTGKVSPTHCVEAEQRIEDWQKSSYQCFSRYDLLRLMQDYIEGASPPVPSVNLPVHGQEIFKRIDEITGITSWMFTMVGQDVGRLFDDIGIRIFARNIRGYLGNTSINKSMELTINDEPEHFWYFNNGITIVCDEARKIEKRGGDFLRVTNAQIINGQQTTRALALNKSKNAEVLVKLVEIPRDETDRRAKYSHVVNEIVASTNWQNAISQSDLRANDPEQVRMEREFRKLDYYYLRKRMSKSEARRNSGNRYSWVIKKEDIARAVGACVLDPLEVRMGRDRLFEEDVYKKIFNGCSAAEYLLYHWFNRRISSLTRGDSRRGYARWLVLNFVWSNLGHRLKTPDMRERFRLVSERHWKYKWEFSPLDRIADTAFLAAMAFFRRNKRRDGRIMDESTFFKHKNLHREFEVFWKKQPSAKKRLFDRRCDKFIERLQAIER